LLFVITPANDQPAASASDGGLLSPFRVVLTNPQSWLCGLVAGLLFAPTTIGDMIWGVAFFQQDVRLDYQHAVTAISMVPLGWVVGCPLMGWLADRIGSRKPVLIGGGLLMLCAVAQIAFMPQLLSPGTGLFLFGVASGVAMIPYTIIKESNPDEVKGCATGCQNFLVFGITALIGPVFGGLLGQSLGGAVEPLGHFRQAGLFWMATIMLAIVISLFLRETGHKRVNRQSDEIGMQSSARS
jgi:MFS family permease